MAAYLFVHAPAFVESEGGWLNNPGYHGLSEILYEYTSCAANNGSGFEGLGDNTWFWNYSCGIVPVSYTHRVERVMFKLSGINPNEEMNWKQFLRALLVVNLFGFLGGMVLLVTQGGLPLNPDGNVCQTAHQAFNTCISFMVNCNLQHYSGESGLTYFCLLYTSLFMFIFLSFVFQILV